MSVRRLPEFFALFVTALSLSASLGASALGDDPAGAPRVADVPADPAKNANAQADFDKAFGEWKETLKNLEQIKVRYQAAGADERQNLEKQFAAAIEQAKTLVPRLKEAAFVAYAAAPNGNQDVTTFVEDLLKEDLATDNYEEAFRVAELLIKGGSKIPHLRAYAGLAAFCSDNFDAAGEYFKEAAAANELQPAAGGDEFEMRTLGTAQHYAGLVADYKKKWAREQKFRAAEAKADDLPRVKLETSQGDIVIELYENEAPTAVSNFITLVGKGFYDGLNFHRVIPAFMAQGGDPNGNGTGGPGYNIPCECYDENHREHFRGTLSMAHAGRDTGGSQFFLTFLPTPHLDGKHTAFGRVIEGQDVLSKIRRVQPGSPVPPDKIVKATVVRKRDHDYGNFKKLPEK